MYIVHICYPVDPSKKHFRVGFHQLFRSLPFKLPCSTNILESWLPTWAMLPKNNSSEILVKITAIPTLPSPLIKFELLNSRDYNLKVISINAIKIIKYLFQLCNCDCIINFFMFCLVYFWFSCFCRSCVLGPCRGNSIL